MVKKLGVPYTVNLSYNLAGDMTSLTYPSGRVVNYAYNSANRNTGVTFASFNGVTSGYQYLSMPQHFASGADYVSTFGNGISETNLLNNRLQGQQITTSNPALGTLSDLAYTFTRPEPDEACFGLFLSANGRALQGQALRKQEMNMHYKGREKVRIRTAVFSALMILSTLGISSARAGRAIAESRAEDTLPQCTGCTRIPFEVVRTGPPSDMDLPEVRIVGERSGAVTAVRHWFDGKQPQSRLIESTAERRSLWIELAKLHQGDAARKVIYASGSGKSRILLMHDYNTGSIQRSTDSGASWKQLKFSIDEKSVSEWIRRLDSTPGRSSDSSSRGCLS